MVLRRTEHGRRAPVDAVRLPMDVRIVRVSAGHTGARAAQQLPTMAVHLSANVHGRCGRERQRADALEGQGKA